MALGATATGVVAALRAAGYRDIQSDSSGEITYASLDRTFGGRPTVYAGHAATLTDMAALRRAQVVVIEDDAKASHLERLVAALDDTGGRLRTFSQFCDLLWDGDTAVEWALEDSSHNEGTGLPHEPNRNPAKTASELYVFPWLCRPAQTDVNVKERLLAWVDGDREAFNGNVVLIEGDAGTGKSELARALARRSAVNYQNALRSARPIAALPPLALRVPLRQTDSLSIGLIRDYLLREAGLTKLTETMLKFLLMRRRVALLLDGVDEMTVSLPKAEADLGVLRELTQEGAQVLATARRGTRKRKSPARVIKDAADDLPEGIDVLELGPLDHDSAVELLQNHGSPATEAEEIASGLPNELKGVPLFLLWSMLSSHLPRSGTKVHALLDLIEGICQRELTRPAIVQIETAEQMEALTQVAVELEDGPLTTLDLGNFVEPESQFVAGPHALLNFDEQGEIQFRHEAFRSVLLAAGLARYWRESCGARDADHQSWLLRRLGTNHLDPLTNEYLSQLLEFKEVSHAWSCASLAPASSNPYLRRNLLVIALAKAHVEAAESLRGQTRPLPQEVRRVNTNALARSISDLSLRGCHLDRVVLSQFDFRDWNLTDLKGKDAEFQLCAFEGATLDTTIYATECVDPIGLPPPPEDED